MPQAWIPPRGELEKKVVSSPCCGNETTTSYDRAFSFRGGEHGAETVNGHFLLAETHPADAVQKRHIRNTLRS